VIVGLLLAAGGARRFGSQKLVQPVHGTPLVRHSATTLGSATDALIVVVGHEADAVRAALSGIDATFVTNDVWAEGLGSSLRAGVRALPPTADAVIVGLGDQPLGDGEAVRAVILRWRASGKPIVAARYGRVRAHPLLFDRRLFSELEQAAGDVGARPIIDRDAARVELVDASTPMPPDVDTVADLPRLAAAIDAAGKARYP